jgi:putative tryptophan/tyrosine transport system substrate-binding protein
VLAHVAIFGPEHFPTGNSLLECHSLANGSGNLTGVATGVPGEFNGKILGILREALPQAKRLAVFINPSNEIHRLLFPETPAAAAKLGF